MKLQHETIRYDIEEALVYLKRLLKKVKNKTLVEEEFIPEMEHILCHLNFSVNARFLSRKKVSKLSQAEYRNYTFPPKEKRRVKTLKRKKGKNWREKRSQGK